MSRILVINPNSSREITAAIDWAMQPLRMAGGPQIVCDTLAAGPPAIETQDHIDEVVRPLSRKIAGERADAFVIACFSDPGLQAARAAVAQPVLGIGESAFLHALSLGKSFGIVSILEQSIPRHLRHVRTLGLEARMAGDRAINLGVLDSTDPGRALERIVAVGTQLRDEDGADVLILGCAGMARHRAAVEANLRMPVVDPCQAAVASAISLLTLGYGRIRA